MLKALLATAGSAIAGALSSWASAIGAVFGFGNKALDAAHDANERTAGINEDRAEVNAAAAKVNQNVAQAAVDLASDDAAAQRLRQGSA